MANTIAVFQISTDEDLRFQLRFIGLELTDLVLKVYVRERSSNTQKVALAIGTGLTLSGSDSLTAYYAKASMSGWGRGEYEADLVDETSGRALRLLAVRFVYDYPGNLVYGVRGNQATITWGGNSAVVTAIGGVGPAGPANSLSIGTVDTLETGVPATASISGTAPTQTLNLGLPKGDTGTAATIAVGDVSTLSPGTPATVDNVGTSAAAVFDFGIPAGADATVAVGTVTTGAAGSSATVANVGTAAAAIFDFSIPRGDTGAAGADGIDGADGVDGDKGWSPEFAIVEDGARRVHQVVDWQGGAGTKPATGEYVGATGLVPLIADGVDIRGPAGVATIENGDKGDITTADDGYTWTIDAGAVVTAKIADDAVTFDKVQNVASGVMLGRDTAGSGNVEELTVAEVRALLNLVSHGQCSLTKVSTNLVLSPLNGNKLLINGVPETVPGAGVSLSATGLTPSTAYFVYAYMDSGTMTLEASTTAPVVDGSTGVTTKTGDATRTLVGIWICTTGPAWLADTGANIGGRSYFNRRQKTAVGRFTANRTVASGGSAAEVHSEIRVIFPSFGDDEITFEAQGGWQVTGIATGFANIGIDVALPSVTRQAATATTTATSLNIRQDIVVAAGSHNATIMANVQGGTNALFLGGGNGEVTLAVHAMG